MDKRNDGFDDPTPSGLYNKSDKDEIIADLLRDMRTCPICGTPKIHHRLYGYRCSVNPEHDEMVRNMNEQQLEEARTRWQDLE